MACCAYLRPKSCITGSDLGTDTLKSLLIDGCVWNCTTTVQLNEMSRMMPTTSASSPAAGGVPKGPSNSKHSQPPSRAASSHPTPPALISPEPSPQASTSSASPSPPQRHPSQQDMWTLMSNISFGARRITEGHGLLSSNVLSRLYPLTWDRCSQSTLRVTDGHDVYPELCQQPGVIGEPDSGTGWCYPLTSGDHLVHLVGFAKSMIWELARSEVGGAPYRGAQGAHTQY